jgi:putative endonuclease
LREYFVYILTNWNNKVLYIGVTNDLARRLEEHQNKRDKNSFTAKYNFNKLIHYEIFSDIGEAISREKEMKKWRREKKDKLISEFNNEWKDLSEIAYMH